MRVNNSTPLNGAEIPNSPATAPQVRPSGSGPTAEKSDEVSLSPAGTSALSDRSARISELKSLVNSSAYTPSSSDIGRKLVSEALSRPAEH